MKILITGVAGFIGFHVAYAALKRGDQVIGIDNLNDYYDPSLKEDRLQQLNSLVKDIKGKFTLNENLMNFISKRRNEPQLGCRYNLLY